MFTWSKHRVLLRENPYLEKKSYNKKKAIINWRFPKKKIEGWVLDCTVIILWVYSVWSQFLILDCTDKFLRYQNINSIKFEPSYENLVPN